MGYTSQFENAPTRLAALATLPRLRGRGKKDQAACFSYTYLSRYSAKPSGVAAIFA